VGVAIDNEENHHSSDDQRRKGEYQGNPESDLHDGLYSTIPAKLESSDSSPESTMDWHSADSDEGLCPRRTHIVISAKAGIQTSVPVSNQKLRLVLPTADPQTLLKSQPDP